MGSRYSGYMGRPLAGVVRYRHPEYPELNPSQTLVQHIRLMAAQGKQSVTLCGLVSRIRLCEEIGLISPTVFPIHWAMSAGTDMRYAQPAPAPVWGAPLMLAHKVARVASELDFITVGLAVISVCHLLSVGEVSSIRRCDVSTFRRIHSTTPSVPIAGS